jgi:hypothetical protein
MPPPLCLSQLEDQGARYFHFRKQRAELNWQQVHAVDLDEVIANRNTAMIDAVRSTNRMALKRVFHVVGGLKQGSAPLTFTIIGHSPP